jgi:hypothetical protein
MRRTISVLVLLFFAGCAERDGTTLNPGVTWNVGGRVLTNAGSVGSYGTPTPGSSLESPTAAAAGGNIGTLGIVLNSPSGEGSRGMSSGAAP